MPPKLKSALLYLWLGVNLAIILVSAQAAYRNSLHTEEFAYACDSFGYLRMAEEIRTSVRERRMPEFRLESAQTRLLIEFMKSKDVPIPKWDEVVAPHAHHYFPVSDHVGVQYPPGVGLTLAAFPEGTAVYRLNQATVVVVALLGIAAIALAAWKKAWMSLPLVALALHLTFLILGRIGALSFSINAALAPLLLVCVLVLFAATFQKTRYRLAWSATLAAGLLLGFCTMIRLPAILLAPAMLVLLWPATWKIRLNSLPVVFCLALLIVGILPIVINQQRVAGAWYLSTYARVDAAAPTLTRVRENLSYFFGLEGPAAQDNWSLVFMLIGFACFVLLLRPGKQKSESAGLTWKRLALAAVLAWSLSAGFFLTHAITGAHYMIPAIVVTLVLIGFGSLVLEVTQRDASTLGSEPRIVATLALIGLLLPATAVFRSTLITRAPGNAPAGPLAHARIELPAELADEKAWVWADLLTGSLWYYARKPAFKIQFTDPPTRELLFKFVFDRGEQQYLIQDSEQMRVYMNEIEKLGGTLEQRGKVDGQLYFLVHWPKDGPAIANQTPRVASN
jgi:hypothetical protein